MMCSDYEITLAIISIVLAFTTRLGLNFRSVLLRVPCSIAWVIMDFLSRIDLLRMTKQTWSKSDCYLSWQLRITLQLLSNCNRSLKLSSCFLLCLPLSLVPPVLHVVIDNSSIFSSLIMCQKQFICCSLISFRSSFSVLTNLNNSSLLSLSVQLTFCNLL